MDQPLQPQLRQLVQQRLETLRRAGVNLLLAQPPTASEWQARDAPLAEQTAGNEDVVEQPRAGNDSEAAFSDDYHEEESLTLDFRNQPRLSRKKRIELLEQTGCEVAECTLCSELAETRTQTVFGTGNPQARLVFLGEAPGADEDRQGEPFVGRAGQLLTKIIEACKLRREDVYILNILKCRPPGNRNPAPREADNCRHYLMRQLRIIQPEFICCLGAVAAQNLLDTQTTIGRLRGKIHDFRSIRVVATYHPAYLLRNPNAKRDAWEDIKMLMREMGIDPDRPPTK